MKYKRATSINTLADIFYNSLYHIAILYFLSSHYLHFTYTTFVKKQNIFTKKHYFPNYIIMIVLTMSFIKNSLNSSN